jgi:hypothetical protein
MREAMTSHPPKAVTVTLLNYRKDGTPFWNALHVAPVRDADGVLEYYIGVQLDVSQQQQQAHEAAAAAAAVADNTAGEADNTPDRCTLHSDSCVTQGRSHLW